MVLLRVEVVVEEEPVVPTSSVHQEAEVGEVQGELMSLDLQVVVGVELEAQQMA